MMVSDYLLRDMTVTVTCHIGFGKVSLLHADTIGIIDFDLLHRVFFGWLSFSIT